MTRAEQILALFQEADASGQPRPTVSEIAEKLRITANNVHSVAANARNIGIDIRFPRQKTPKIPRNLPAGITARQYLADRELFERYRREYVSLGLMS